MRFATLLLSLMLASASAWAVGPTTITYQAIFTDDNGELMADGVYEIGFHLYVAPIGGPPVWSEWQDVTVVNGIFEVILGAFNPLTPAVFPQAGAWLGLTHEQEPFGPRQFINAVPYAFVSCWADSARSSANVGSLSEQELINNVNQVDNHETRIDILEADIDTLNDRVSDLEEGGGGQVRSGAFLHNQNFNEIADETGITLESEVFEITGNAILYFAQVVTDDPNGDFLNGQLFLVRDSDDQIMATSAIMKATMGTDLHLQSIAPDSGPNDCYLRVTLWTVGEASSVEIPGINFGAMWVPFND